MQQWRLFPYLAAYYVMKVFGDNLYRDYVRFIANSYDSAADRLELAMAGAQIHALSCAGKSLAGWLARDAIQECREACGGHGYLRAAGIGHLRDDNDANCTYEGDNNVLLQQTSNWLLSIWANPKQGKKASPLPSSVAFLEDIENIASKTFRPKKLQELMQPEVILDAYKWLLCWLLQSTSEKYKSEVEHGKDDFAARNDSQVFFARTLSLVYVEHYVIGQFAIFCSKPGLEPQIAAALRNLLLLFGLWSLEKHLGSLYQGGYASGPLPSSLIREGILALCRSLKGDAVALVDAIAPPDFILNSCLGNSDGEVYKHLRLAMSECPNGLERPGWWRDITRRLQAKL